MNKTIVMIFLSMLMITLPIASAQTLVVDSYVKEDLFDQKSYVGDMLETQETILYKSRDPTLLDNEGDVLLNRPDYKQDLTTQARDGIDPIFSEGPSIIEIYNWGDLRDMKNDLNAYYILMNDLSRYTPGYLDTFSPIGSHLSPFKGRFYGNGYTIKDLPGTLFGAVSGYSAIIQDVKLEDPLITHSLSTDTNDVAAPLVGLLTSGAKIKDSSVVGGFLRISTSSSVACGGLVGELDLNAKIEESYTDVGVSCISGDGSFAGGLVGFVRDGDLENTYARGSVFSSAGVFFSSNFALTIAGGLVGLSWAATIDDSYSTGDLRTQAGPGDEHLGGLVGFDQYATTTIHNSYWDMQTSGQLTSDGGEGRETQEMIIPIDDPSTYVDWDFTLGTGVWKMPPSLFLNDGYPVLEWQEVPAEAIQGTLLGTLLSTNPLTVAQGGSFTYSSKVDCVDGHCGDVQGELFVSDLSQELNLGCSSPFFGNSCSVTESVGVSFIDENNPQIEISSYHLRVPPGDPSGSLRLYIDNDFKGSICQGVGCGHCGHTPSSAYNVNQIYDIDPADIVDGQIDVRIEGGTSFIFGCNNTAAGITYSLSSGEFRVPKQGEATTLNHPFKVVENNPLTKNDLPCLGNVGDGDSCQTNWLVNAVGDTGLYRLFTRYSSTHALNEDDTNKRSITTS